MNLADTLNNYFTQNTDIAESAMHEELTDYFLWKKDDGYVSSAFELWADPQNIKASLAESVGGEGQGSTYYAVYKFAQGDDVAFFKFHGWYASYDGANYLDFQQVHPKEVTKVEYV